MKTNVGKADRIIRAIVAAIIVALYFANIISGTLGLILVTVAVIFFLTSTVGICPIYTLFGMSTCPVKESKS